MEQMGGHAAPRRAAIACGGVPGMAIPAPGSMSARIPVA